MAWWCGGTGLHFVDARGARPTQEIVAELACVLGDPIPPLGALFGVDKPPEHLVQRVAFNCGHAPVRSARRRDGLHDPDRDPQRHRQH
jgi:hypothetical protein